MSSNQPGTGVEAASFVLQLLSIVYSLQSIIRTPFQLKHGLFRFVAIFWEFTNIVFQMLGMLTTANISYDPRLRAFVGVLLGMGIAMMGVKILEFFAPKLSFVTKRKIIILRAFWIVFFILAMIPVWIPKQNSFLMGIIFVSLAILYENLQALFVLKVVLKEMKSKHGKISIRYKAAMLKNIINLIFGIAGIVAIFLSFLATGDTASIAGVLGEAIFGNQVSLLVDTFKIVAKIPIGDTKIHPQTDSEMTSQRVTESKEVEDQDVNQPDSGDGKGSVSRKGLEVAISEPPPIAGSPNSVRHAQIVLPIGVENGLPNKLPPLPTDPHRLTKKKSLHQTIVEKKLSEIHSEISSIKSRESSFAKDNQDI